MKILHCDYKGRHRYYINTIIKQENYCPASVHSKYVQKNYVHRYIYIHSSVITFASFFLFFPLSVAKLMFLFLLGDDIYMIHIGKLRSYTVSKSLILFRTIKSIIYSVAFFSARYSDSLGFCSTIERHPTENMLTSSHFELHFLSCASLIYFLYGIFNMLRDGKSS